MQERQLGGGEGRGVEGRGGGGERGGGRGGRRGKGKQNLNRLHLSAALEKRRGRSPCLALSLQLCVSVCVCISLSLRVSLSQCLSLSPAAAAAASVLVNNELILMGLARRQRPSLAATVLPRRGQTAYSAGIGDSGPRRRAANARAQAPRTPGALSLPTEPAEPLGDKRARRWARRPGPAPRAQCAHTGPASPGPGGLCASTCDCFSDK